MSIDRRVCDDPTAEEAGDDDNGNRPVEAAPVTLSPKWLSPGLSSCQGCQALSGGLSGPCQGLCQDPLSTLSSLCQATVK